MVACTQRVLANGARHMHRHRQHRARVRGCLRWSNHFAAAGRVAVAELRRSSSQPQRTKERRDIWKQKAEASFRDPPFENIRFSKFKIQILQHRIPDPDSTIKILDYDNPRSCSKVDSTWFCMYSIFLPFIHRPSIYLSLSTLLVFAKDIKGTIHSKSWF